jgi:hypothetical protein
MARISLRSNPKFMRLARAIQRPQYQARGLLEMLWEAAHENGPVFKTLDDVEVVSTWDGQIGLLGASLVDCGLLDKVDDGFFIHDYWEHCPKWVRDREAKRMHRAEERRSAPKSAVERRSAPFGAEERRVSDKVRHGAPSLAKPSVDQDTSCAEPVSPASTQQVPLFVPSTEDPYPKGKGPYNINPKHVHTWFQVIDCDDERGWPFTYKHGKALVERFAGTGTDAGAIERLMASQIPIAAGWIKDNPTRRKTPRGMPQFIAGWMMDKFNKGRHQ